MRITGMQMLDNSAAQIRWRLTGRMGMLPIDVAGALPSRELLHLLHPPALPLVCCAVRRAEGLAAPHVPGLTSSVLVLLAPCPVRRTPPPTLPGTTDISMNLLTGRIEKQSERHDLSKCSPPAAAAWRATRAVWAAQRASADAGKAANSMLDSLTSMDDDVSAVSGGRRGRRGGGACKTDGWRSAAAARSLSTDPLASLVGSSCLQETYQQPNPNDPMKFFQQVGKEAGTEGAV